MPAKLIVISCGARPVTTVGVLKGVSIPFVPIEYIDMEGLVFRRFKDEVQR